MEFIPLEKYSKKTKKTKSEVTKDEQSKKLKKAEVSKDESPSPKKTKTNERIKVLEKKKVKNKYRETLTQKRKSKAPKKKKEVAIEEEEEEEEGEVEEMEVEEDNVEESKEEEEIVDEEEVFKRKCKELDEKKKNRLFIKMKEKIRSEAQVKELHPDIRGVIFPRKKNSRWCWAVFASEERADEALKQLVKNEKVFATKPNPHERVAQKRKDKMKVVLRKKQAKKKLQEMWA